MGNFNKFGGGDRGGRGFGGGGFGGGRKFGGQGGGPRQMFQTTCSKCGQNCEVPFRPTGERPVFCNNCFKNQDAPSNRFAPKSFGGGGNAPSRVNSGVTKEQFETLNNKLDKILSILSPAKPTKVESSAKEMVVEVKKEKIKAKPAEKKVATKKKK